MSDRCPHCNQRVLVKRNAANRRALVLNPWPDAHGNVLIRGGTADEISSEQLTKMRISSLYTVHHCKEKRDHDDAKFIDVHGLLR